MLNDMLLVQVSQLLASSNIQMHSRIKPAPVNISVISPVVSATVANSSLVSNCTK